MKKAAIAVMALTVLMCLFFAGCKDTDDGNVSGNEDGKISDSTPSASADNNSAGDDISKGINDAGNGVSNAMNEAGDAVSDAARGAGDVLRDAGDAVSDAARDIGNGARDLRDDMR